jgi:regulator of RNase E activity RraA
MMAMTLVGWLSVAALAAAQTPSEVLAPDGLRANRITFSPIMDVLGRPESTVTDAQLEQLADLPLESIWSTLGEYRVNYVRGFTSTQPGARVAGRALTMRFLPPRPDLVEAIDTLAAEGDWDRRYYARAAEEARPGDIVVAELGGADGHNLFGAMGALGIKLRGVRGVIIDGGSRDLIELQDGMFAGFPVFARFFDVHTTSWLGVEWNAPVRIGRTTVLPGDVVVADDGGALFFPERLVAQVLEAASARDALEEYERELLRSRMYRFRDIYPLSEELREEYERQRR